MKAIIKFNGGKGSLLCNRCGVILKTGFDHDLSKEHFCEEGCEEDHPSTCRCEVCRFWGA